MDSDIINTLIHHAENSQNPFVDYNNFLNSLTIYAQNKNPNLLHRLSDHQIEIIPTLVELEYKGDCTLVRKDGVVTGIIVHSVLEDKIKHYFYLIENDPQLPFPTEESFAFPIPPKILESIDINSGFVNLLGSLDALKKSIIKIGFPGNVKNLVVPKEYVKSKLLECCVYKIQAYLQERMNVGYMTSRLEVVLSGTITAIKNMLNDIVTKPKKAIAGLYDVDDFAFKFWSQLGSVIIQDFREKKDTLKDEQGYCQAAFIIGIYIGYQKAVIQKKYQKSLDQKQLDSLIKKPPYAFTLDDLYNLKDGKGVRFSEKYSREFIHDFIYRSTKVGDSKELPFLIRLKIDDAVEYFIQKDLIIPLFLNKLHECARVIKLDLTEEWQTLLKNNIKIPSMKNDTDFDETLRRRIKSHYKLLFALLNPHLLYISKLETNISQNNLLAIERYFTRGNKLKPLSELLNLSRSRLLREIKTMLPVWCTVPVLRQLYFLCRWLFGRGRQKRKQTLNSMWEKIKHEFKRGVDREYADLLAEHEKVSVIPVQKQVESEEVKSKDKAQQYRKALQDIRQHLLGKNINSESRMKSLVEKWNPLFDPAARSNLEEDVNALIRDFLRSIKRSFKIRPPTLEQIHNLAADLSMNKNLKEIKRKESLRMYIELYMIKILEERFIHQLL
jgi:hypothetical protein